MPNLLAATLPLLRREGFSPDDAQDLTQGFFADLIQTHSYARADREKGRFRSFLLGALKHFVADARDRERAQKRGGGIVPEQFDENTISEVEAQVGRATRWKADHVYEREWAARFSGRHWSVWRRNGPWRERRHSSIV